MSLLFKCIKKIYQYVIIIINLDIFRCEYYYYYYYII